MHTESPILKETEEQIAKILDTDYLRVNIDCMVDGSDIDPKNKVKLKETLHKFLDIFSGGFGESKSEKTHITLNPGIKPFYSHYHNLLEA